MIREAWAEVVQQQQQQQSTAAVTRQLQHTSPPPGTPLCAKSCPIPLLYHGTLAAVLRTLINFLQAISDSIRSRYAAKNTPQTFVYNVVLCIIIHPDRAALKTPNHNHYHHPNILFNPGPPCVCEMIDLLRCWIIFWKVLAASFSFPGC